mmetsp:Transcript_19906/g.43329  ORF Transcript_19906/g.43329 Transcript_19906/m.43329 type:complete len:204 (-) Transcript_19906:513-1124(-)
MPSRASTGEREGGRMPGDTGREAPPCSLTTTSISLTGPSACCDAWGDKEAWSPCREEESWDSLSHAPRRGLLELAPEPLCGAMRRESLRISREAARSSFSFSSSSAWATTNCFLTDSFSRLAAATFCFASRASVSILERRMEISCSRLLSCLSFLSICSFRAASDSTSAGVREHACSCCFKLVMAFSSTSIWLFRLTRSFSRP